MAIRTFRIEAAIFEDASSVGSKPHSDFLRVKRLGRMLENERIARLLRKDLEHPLVDNIGSLPTSIGDLPASIDSALRSLAEVSLPGASIENVRHIDEHSQYGFLEGVRNAREEGRMIVSQISSLSTSPGQRPQTDALNQIVKRYEDRSITYRAYLAQLERGGR